MKTLQEQYNLLKEGKGQKDVFMKTARGQFPNLFNNLSNFDTAVKVLKQKSIISEGGIGGVVTGGKNPFINWEAFLAEDAKAVEKEPTKEVTDMETRGFDYKDEKNIDNLYGEAFLQGYYTEMKDPANEGKDVTELKEIVAKNLAKDKTYYATEAQFGIKGIGYTDEAPGLKASKSDQMVPVKENMIKLTDIINEAVSGYVDLRPIGMNEKQGYNDELDDSLGLKYGSKEQDMDQRRADSENMEKADGDRKYSGDKSKDKKKKVRKETIDTKLSEIENAGKATTLEAQIEAVDEAIDTKNQRISMVTEDENLSELVDKAKMREMQREVKMLEKRKAGMQKLYEKLTGEAYVRTEMVDEADDVMEY
tara:strand:- start:322 stop:1416 length:1095 start_codon:yes stop_codon:yes gene_type:complete